MQEGLRATLVSQRPRIEADSNSQTCLSLELEDRSFHTPHLKMKYLVESRSLGLRALSNFILPHLNTIVKSIYSLDVVIDSFSFRQKPLT